MLGLFLTAFTGCHVEFVLLEIWIDVAAEDLVLSAADVLEFLQAYDLHRFLHRAVFKGDEHPTLFFDILKNPPTFRSDLIREPLDVSRATCRVDHMVEAAFFA